MPDDNKLWKAVGSDDYAAFDLVVDRYYEALVSFSASITREYEKSRDIVQEIFIHLWTDRKSERNVLSLRDYLYTATRNRSLNHLRSLRRQRERVAALTQDEYNVWKDIVENEVKRLLAQAIDSLPERNRRVILCTLDGMKQEQIAGEMDISVRTVKVLKAESVRALREFLDADNDPAMPGKDRQGNKAFTVILTFCV